jgi:hypothetical protein
MFPQHMACFANRWHVSPTDCALAGCIVATVRPKSPWRTSEPGEEARRRSRPICDRASSINRFRGRISAWPISWPNCYRVEIANVGSGTHRRPQRPRAVRNETYLPRHPRAHSDVPSPFRSPGPHRQTGLSYAACDNVVTSFGARYLEINGQNCLPIGRSNERRPC